MRPEPAAGALGSGRRQCVLVVSVGVVFAEVVGGDPFPGLAVGEVIFPGITVGVVIVALGAALGTLSVSVQFTSALVASHRWLPPFAQLLCQAVAVGSARVALLSDWSPSPLSLPFSDSRSYLLSRRCSSFVPVPPGPGG